MTIPIRASAPDGSIVAAYIPSNDSGSDKKKIMIKCYDAKVSLASLKYTLSSPAPSDGDKKFDNEISSMAFTASNKFLVVSMPQSNSILVFDLHRGVLSGTINVDKSQPLNLSSIAVGAENVYALVHKDGKTLVLAYDLNTLNTIKKIKTGSCDDDHLPSLAFDVYTADDDSDANDNSVLAVKIGKKIKFLDPVDGSVLYKSKIKMNDDSNATTSFLKFSSDGKILLANTSNKIHVFRANTSKGSGDDKNGASIAVAPLSNVFDVSIRANISISREYIISATATNGEKTSLLHLELASYSKPITIQPFAIVSIPISDNSTNVKKSKVLDAFFSRQKGNNDVIVMELTTTGLSNINVQMMKVPYSNSDGFLSGDLYPKDDEDEDEMKEFENQSSGKKRKAPTTASTATSSANIVLGSGESGGEAMTVTDATSTSKRAKLADSNDSEGDDDFLLLDDEDDEGGATIAQKLALLSSELDREQEEDHEHLLQRHYKNINGVNGDGITGVGEVSSSMKSLKVVTSDSLVILLRQALLSNDDSQLEVVLSVSDKKVIENTIIALSKDQNRNQGDGQTSAGEIIIILLTKLVSRISRKPARAQNLSFWIRTVLVALISSTNKDSSGNGQSTSTSSLSLSKQERDIAARLAPLRSMLSERVQSLPALLRLEGRLNLIGKKY